MCKETERIKTLQPTFWIWTSDADCSTLSNAWNIHYNAKFVNAKYWPTIDAKARVKRKGHCRLISLPKTRSVYDLVVLSGTGWSYKGPTHSWRLACSITQIQLLSPISTLFNTVNSLNGKGSCWYSWKRPLNCLENCCRRRDCVAGHFVFM